MIKMFVTGISVMFCFITVSGQSVKQAAHLPIITHQDTTDIKRVIAGETQAFADRDSTRLLAYYTDDVITQSAWNNPTGSFTVLHGKDSIRANFARAFKNNPNRVYLPEIKRSRWTFRKLSADWMWVNFHQEIITTDGKVYGGYETRMMKKESEGWKIAVMYALNDHGKPAN